MIPVRAKMGHLELAVMETLWTGGDGSVHDVVRRLNRGLAYNTVMTTLDRLHKKGLLNRTRQARAYLYTPKLSRLAWQRQQAGTLLAEFLSGDDGASGLLVSCLVDAVGQHDIAVLDELEARIRARRSELDRTQFSGGSE